MIVFNLFAVLDFFLAVGLFWVVCQVVPGMRDLDSLKVFEVGPENLAFAILVYSVGTTTEQLGLRGRLFWLPTYLLGAALIGYQLTDALGSWAWTVAALLALCTFAMSWWLKRIWAERKQQQATLALLAAERCAQQSDWEGMWPSLKTAFIVSGETDAATVAHNRRVLAVLRAHLPDKHRTHGEPLLEALEASYHKAEGGQKLPRLAHKLEVLQVAALISKRGAIPVQAQALMA